MIHHVSVFKAKRCSHHRIYHVNISHRHIIRPANCNALQTANICIHRTVSYHRPLFYAAKSIHCVIHWISVTRSNYISMIQKPMVSWIWPIRNRNGIVYGVVSMDFRCISGIIHKMAMIRWAKISFIIFYCHSLNLYFIICSSSFSLQQPPILTLNLDQCNYRTKSLLVDREICPRPRTFKIDVVHGADPDKPDRTRCIQPYFISAESQLDLELWLSEIQKIFDMIKCWNI